MDYTDLMKLIKERRSIRRFTKQSLGRDRLLQITEAALWAPTGCNIQPWKFHIICEKPDLLRQLTNVMVGISHAPPAIICITIDSELEKSRKGVVGEEGCGLIDAGICAQNMMLAAYSLNLGSCLFRSFDADAVSSLLALPKSQTPELMVALGYPLNANVPVPPRRCLDEVVQW